MNWILYTTLKLIFIGFPLFLPYTNPHSEPIGQHTTSPPPSHYITFPPSSGLPATHFPCRMTTQTFQRTHSRACLSRQHVYLHETVFCNILNVFYPLCPCACVFSDAWLRIPDISFFAIHMGPSSLTFSTRFVVTAHSHFWTDLNQTLHTSPPWSGEGRRVCMNPQYFNFPTFSTYFVVSGCRFLHGRWLPAPIPPLLP
jgi:hypothetical protein